jgi:hypothetical protein
MNAVLVEDEVTDEEILALAHRTADKYWHHGNAALGGITYGFSDRVMLDFARKVLALDESSLESIKGQKVDRPWQGITDEEIEACKPTLGIVKMLNGDKVDSLWVYDFAQAIEEKLMEKNA